MEKWRKRMKRAEGKRDNDRRMETKIHGQKKKLKTRP